MTRKIPFGDVSFLNTHEASSIWRHKLFAPKILDQGLKIRQIAYEKKMTWKKGQEFRPSGQRPWRQRNRKHGKNVVLAGCTYGFLKGVSFNRRLLVS